MIGAMDEIELKLQVPAARADAVRRAVAGRTGAAPMRLQAAYFDTEDRALAAAGLALRLRREGRRWVQTLKGAGDDGLTRLEHEVARGSAAAMPALDLALHDGTPVGARLAALRADASHGEPRLVFRTDVRRTLREQRVAGARLELAFDEGRIVAGDAVLPVCELEIELRAGTPDAVLAAARRWIERHGLWIDLRSKAERGDALARGLGRWPERKARPVELGKAMTPAQARRAVIASCLDQIAGNASVIAGGSFGDDHVHQLRVGLRRLRSAWRFFADRGTDAEAGAAVAPDPAEAAAASLFRALGAARDLAAVGVPLQQELRTALAAVGLQVEPPRLPVDAQAPEPVALLRAGAAQALLLDLLAAAQPRAPGDVSAAPPLRTEVAARLNRWHKQLAADAKRFADLDDVGRHRVRKRAKRLRYAAEFVAGLFGAKAVRRYLEPLRALQERLGAQGRQRDVDVVQRAAPRVPGEAGLPFALGWLAARREARLAEALPALKRFADAKRFWK